MNKIIISLVVVGIISIGINVWFFSGKGITFNSYTTNHQEQFQQQFQGQLLVNQWTAQGDKIEWKEVYCDNATYLTELDKLHPISSMYAKIIFMDHGLSKYIRILYPEIFTKTLDKEAKK